jgi:hypothetical protein
MGADGVKYEFPVEIAAYPAGRWLDEAAFAEQLGVVSIGRRRLCRH